MTLFELQAWLGHRTPTTTQHYAKITPNTLSRAYNDAGYFARNVRTIEVLVDRDAVTTGAAADGQPWQHYDLGHGYCGYSFFEQCPHRMACAATPMLMLLALAATLIAVSRAARAEATQRATALCNGRRGAVRRARDMNGRRPTAA